MELGHQSAGENAVNVEINGNGNVVNITAPKGLEKAFEGGLVTTGTERPYQIMICNPSDVYGIHPWSAFSNQVVDALRSHGFEVVIAGTALARKQGETVYQADQKALFEHSCNALLVLACDYVTLSQLTHLISHVLVKGVVRKEIVILPDPSLIAQETYFTEGALSAARRWGVVMDIDKNKNLLEYVDDIVRQFVTSRNFFR